MDTSIIWSSDEETTEVVFGSNRKFINGHSIAVAGLSGKVAFTAPQCNACYVVVAHRVLQVVKRVPPSCEPPSRLLQCRQPATWRVLAHCRVVIAKVVVVVVAATIVTRTTSAAASTELGASAAHACLVTRVRSGTLPLGGRGARVQNVSHDAHELRVGGAEKPGGVVFNGEAHVS